MLSFLLTSLLVSSPYPFEVKSGFVLEPTLGYLFQDSTNKSRATGGARLSYIHSDITDAIITGELQFLTATSFRNPTDASGKSKIVTDTNYYLEASIVFMEIYNPVAFRLVGGGGVERASETRADIYYRGGLGRYFSGGFGLFVDAAGRIIFRSNKTVYPIEIGLNTQFIF